MLMQPSRQERHAYCQQRAENMLIQLEVGNKHDACVELAASSFQKIPRGS